LQARKFKPDFVFKYIMIDKSQTEMAAVRLLVAKGFAKGFLLCYFHIMQDLERFVSSSDAAVPEKAERKRIIHAVALLTHNREKAVFNREVGSQAMQLQQPAHLPSQTMPLLDAAGCLLCRI